MNIHPMKHSFNDYKFNNSQLNILIIKVDPTNYFGGGGRG